jgi:hypothetical protein
MLAALTLALLTALATSSEIAWWTVVVLLPVLLSYVAVLVRSRRMRAEREINVAFFGSSGRASVRLEDVFARPVDQAPYERMAAGGASR